MTNSGIYQLLSGSFSLLPLWWEACSSLLWPLQAPELLIAVTRSNNSSMLAQSANAANKEKFAVCLGQLKWSTTLACSDLAHGVSLWSMTDPRSSKPPWYIIVFHNTWLRVWAFIYFMMIFLMVLFLHLLHTPRSCMLTTNFYYWADTIIAHNHTFAHGEEM